MFLGTPTPFVFKGMYCGGRRVFQEVDGETYLYWSKHGGTESEYQPGWTFGPFNYEFPCTGIGQYFTNDNALEVRYINEWTWMEKVDDELVPVPFPIIHQCLSK